MKTSLQVLIFFFACALIASANPVEETVTSCTTNETCRWAVCNWSQWFAVSPEHCDFVENSCQCPLLTECKKTNSMRPGSQFIIYLYRCSF